MYYVLEKLKIFLFYFIKYMLLFFFGIKCSSKQMKYLSLNISLMSFYQYFCDFPRAFITFPHYVKRKVIGWHYVFLIDILFSSQGC